VGHAVSAQPEGAPCDVNVTVATPGNAFAGAAVAAAGSLPAAFAYSSGLTAAVTGISPASGSSLGGDAVAFTGSGLAASVESVHLNGVPCAVTAVAGDSSVTCVTGARAPLADNSVAVLDRASTPRGPGAARGAKLVSAWVADAREPHAALRFFRVPRKLFLPHQSGGVACLTCP